MYKYYLIKNGWIQKSKSVYPSEEKNIIKEYKKLARSIKIRDGYIKTQEIDEILIIENFRRRKLKVIKV